MYIQNNGPLSRRPYMVPKNSVNSNKVGQLAYMINEPFCHTKMLRSMF